MDAGPRMKALVRAAALAAGEQTSSPPAHFLESFKEAFVFHRTRFNLLTATVSSGDRAPAPLTTDLPITEAPFPDRLGPSPGATFSVELFRTVTGGESPGANAGGRVAGPASR